MKRRFITKADIDRVAESGQQVLEVDGPATVTDLAREHAMQRGVRVVLSGGPGGGGPVDRRHGVYPESAPAGAASDPGLVRRVRAAVVAKLGQAPEGLDETIERVLRRT